MQHNMIPKDNELQVSPIYYATMKAVQDGARRIIHQGGQWSGKTVNILAALATLAANEYDTITTVTAESFPHLKGGAMRDFERYIYPKFKHQIASYHKTDHIFTFKKGAMIEFRTYEDETAARGPKRTRLFINEANKFDYMTYFQLDSRSELSILDYNPTAKFWAHDVVQPLPGTHFLLSDHRHNPFLSRDKHREIEGIKDPELWRVYARGMTGNIVGIIYPDWVEIDDLDYPNDEEPFWAIDFGYTNDPTAIVKLCRKGNKIFAHEVGYTAGSLTATKIKELLYSNGYKEDQVLYCEHDGDMIRQLRINEGILAIAAKKGPGSIKAGIFKIKEYDMYYTCSSRNISEERKRYVWMTDKDTGKSLNVPTDAWNHILDAIRYGVYSHFYRSPD